MNEKAYLQLSVGYTPANMRVQMARLKIAQLKGPRQWLAAEIGVHPDTVSRWCQNAENPRHQSPTYTTWQKVVKAVNELVANPIDRNRYF